MRRFLLFVSSALLLTGGGGLAFAQHGGGGHASGGHSSGTHGASSGSHSSAFRASSGYGTANHGIYPVTTVPLAGVNGINPGALSAGPYRPGRGYGNGYGYGYGNRRFANYGYYPYFPLFDDYDDYGYSSGGYNQGYADPAAQTAAVTGNLLGDQVQRLTDEVEAMREERDQQYAAPQPRSRYNAPPLLPDDQTPSSAPVTLILQDGKKLELQSYAVMGNQIWDFSAQPAKKISIANVNIAASEKATEANGGEFPDFGRR